MSVFIKGNSQSFFFSFLFFVAFAINFFLFSSSEWSGFFNWTMTFRTDSDFYTPYGKIEATAKLPHNIDKYIQVETFIQLREQKNPTP